MNDLYSTLKQKLADVMPEFEIALKADIATRINALKKEKNAVILGHNYMEPALYLTIPDFTGDSLELCRKAANTNKDIIVFCGVRFMAETAKILNPEKKVLIPSPRAGCSLAESITADDVRQLRQLYPGVPIITYINTYADVKAECDVCCTSGNAVKVVESFGDQPVIFLPDEYLASNVAKETGKKIIFPIKSPKGAISRHRGLDYQVVGWQGRCEVHEQFTVDDIENVRKQFPDVVILAHPECSPQVVDASDFSGSTSEMLAYVKDVDAPRYLLLTECSMGDNIAAENPHREMLRLCSIRCPHMGEITLEDTLKALQLEQYEVDVPEDVRQRALASVERMLAIH